MPNSLGLILKETRQSLHLTQKEVSKDICAQSMLSAIENNKYTPNAQLLIQLCHKLSITLDQISLLENFDISSENKFNEHVSKLCNQHQYKELLQFLNQETVINNLKTDKQLQAYYYYIGVATLHTKNKLIDTEKYIKLSLASRNKILPDTLTRLGTISLAFIYAKQNLQNKAEKYIDQTFLDFNKLSYEENQNILFYLTALIYFNLNDLTMSFNWINKSVKFATDHNSHYMLANSFYLMAQIAKRAEDKDNFLAATEKQQLLTGLFNEQIYKNI
ncbi:helix-turn-helix domain-containing protein [Dellaglioa sp. P0083]|uniref:helix-turn-helix domain-containing protein n=1 Tax=Dellaglioa kimchii TaxID=3344667 RepID=UPI0038D454AD